MKLRQSRVLNKLRSGGVAGCIKLNLGDPRVAELAALCGFDCIWIDLEHTPNDLREIEGQIRAAKIHDTDALVRVPRGGSSDLLYPLEMDAAGIMIPHVMNVADALDLVRRTRFHPLGLRPLDGGNADGAYCLVPLEEYMRHGNEQRMLVLQIEDPEPLDDLDAIAALPGVDMLFFGPGDFSQSIGTPGRLNDQRVASARMRVAESARRHGKFAGTVATPETMHDRIEEGYRFLSIGADVVALGRYFGAIASAVADVRQPVGRMAPEDGDRPSSLPRAVAAPRS